MSEESFHSFTTPPAIEKTAADSLRRHSIGKSTSSSTMKHVPHYLRASTGSCHDLCKYGKHVAEESQLLAKKKKKATLAPTKPDPTERVRVKPLPISKALLSESEAPKSKTHGLQVSKLKTHVSYTTKPTKQHDPSSDRVHLSVAITASKARDSKIYVKRATSNRIMSSPVSSARPFLSSGESSKQRNLRAETPCGNETKIGRSQVKKCEHGSKLGSEKVVLRHEEVEEKREAKALLLNNVIEETASKLSGTNKSRVKVLVGAFETVIISLQDC